MKDIRKNRDTSILLLDEDDGTPDEFPPERVPRPIFGYYEHEKNTKRYRRYYVYGDKGLCGQLYLLKRETPERQDAPFIFLKLKGKRKHPGRLPDPKPQTPASAIDADDDADD